MAGSYRKISQKKWELCVSLGYDINGKKIRKYKYVEAKNKKEVELMLAEFVTECGKISYSKYGNLKLKEFFELWLKDYAEIGLRKKTVSRYKTLWPRIEYCLGDMKLSNIRPTKLIEFYKMLGEDGVRLDGKPGGLSKTTIKHHHALLSSVLDSAMNWELINTNPCSKIKISKLGLGKRNSKKKIDESIYTIEQTKTFLKALDKVDLKYKLFMNLAIFTGCRREELLGLEWRDFNYDTGEIKIERAVQYTPHDGIYEDDLKTSKSHRSCFVPKYIIEMIKDYRLYWDKIKENLEENNLWTNTEKLFIQRNGDLMHPDSQGSWLRKFLKANNLPHTKLHNLRHIHGSILLALGMDMNSVADQLGHEDLQMLVSIYSHNIYKKNYETAEFMTKALLDDEE